MKRDKSPNFVEIAYQTDPKGRIIFARVGMSFPSQLPNYGPFPQKRKEKTSTTFPNFKLLHLIYVIQCEEAEIFSPRPYPMKRGNDFSMSSIRRFRPAFYVYAAAFLSAAALVFAIKDGKLNNLSLSSWTVQASSSERLRLVPGLQNLGNNCFFNVILQVLLLLANGFPFLAGILIGYMRNLYNLSLQLASTEES